MQTSKRHHYLPQFYLHRWAGDDGRLWEFGKPYKEVKGQAVLPVETGFQMGLYKLHGAPDQEAAQIEDVFMKSVDTAASQVLDALEKMNGEVGQDAEFRNVWSRFLFSLMLRMPRDIQALKDGVTAEWSQYDQSLEEKYAKIRKPEMPPTFKEFLQQHDPHSVTRFAVSLLPTLIDHPWVIALFNSMHWYVRPVENGLMTSDQPVLISLPVTQPDAYILLPLGPDKVFAAVKDVDTWRKLERKSNADLVDVMNSQIVAHANQFAYANSESALPFISEHFGVRQLSAIMELLAAKRKQSADKDGQLSV